MDTNSSVIKNMISEECNNPFGSIGEQEDIVLLTRRTLNYVVKYL
jgi:hypothetical protein